MTERLKLELDETDMEPKRSIGEWLTDAELVARLHDVAYAIAECDLQPPTRIRHLATIDLAIARLRSI